MHKISYQKVVVMRAWIHNIFSGVAILFWCQPYLITIYMYNYVAPSCEMACNVAYTYFVACTAVQIDGYIVGYSTD